MGVAALVVAVGQDHLRALTADRRHQAAGRLVDVGPVERLGMVVRWRVGHAGIPVAEHHHVVEADDPGRLGELERPQLGEHRLLLFGAEAEHRPAVGTERRVLEVALLASGAADQHGVHPFGVVLRHRRGTLRRLVIGVGVDCEQRKGGPHEVKIPGRPDAVRRR